jgi:hypothetical protein
MGDSARMATDTENAESYRVYAQGLRKKAAAMSSFEARDSMITVAMSYETIANVLDGIDATGLNDRPSRLHAARLVTQGLIR